MNKKNFQEEASHEAFVADNLAEDMPKNQEPTCFEANDINEVEMSADNLSEIELEEKLSKLNDAYLRLMAEYDNYRKRTLKEKTDLIKNGGEKVLSGLLPVIDDFERALETVHKAKDMKAVEDGLDLIYHKFMTFLQQNGVKPIEPLGKEFDEDLSEAVAVVPAANEDQKGMVIDNVQTGYTLNDKVLRHAKVVVAN